MVVPKSLDAFPDRGAFLSAIGRWIFIAVLIVPSIGLLITTPPLWRDSDGWSQITTKPNVLTILHWPPAYCFGARVPLWVGTKVGELAGLNGPPERKFFREPNITDGGVYGLVATQHLLLLVTMTLVVAALTPNGWLRLVLALIIAGQTPLYIYAQTVTSETLSLILNIAFLLAAWRLVIVPGGLSVAGWLIAAGLFFALVATRHVNAAFASLLPLYFLSQGFLHALRVAPASVLPWRESLRGFLLSMVLGVGVIGLNQATTVLLCQLNDAKFRSRMGFTFQWRLASFSSFDDRTWQQVWNSVLPALENQPDLQFVITSHLMKDPSILSKLKLSDTLREIMAAKYPSNSDSEDKYQNDLQMNSLTKAFILHAGWPYWKVVAGDWWDGLFWTTGELAWEPFATTNYFSWPENTGSKAAQELRTLKSFRWFESRELDEMYQGNLYLSIVTGKVAIIVYLGAMLMCAVGLFTRATSLNYATAIYLLACLFSGLIVWWLTKMLTFDLPRFVLPLYAVGLFGLLLGIAGCARLLAPSPVRDSQKSSA